MVWWFRLQYRHWLLPINPLLRAYRLCDICLELCILCLLFFSQISSLCLALCELLSNDFPRMDKGVYGYLDDLCLLLLVHGRRE